MSFRYRRRRNEDNNVDDWLMTYADMITLILCFFAIFLSISIPKKDAMNQMKAEVLKRFSAEEVARNTLLAQGNPYVSEQFSRGNPGAVIPLSGLPSSTAHTQADEEPELKPGDRLSVIDMNSTSFFAVGSATLNDEGKKFLDKVLATVQSPAFKSYKITIEGHTDDSPINTLQFPSNWELSTGRASAVVRYFLEHGVAAARLRASGYADTFPKLPNRDLFGKPIPANQAQNRRVVIKLEKIEKGDWCQN